MAANNLPPKALPDVVLADLGGWISGPSISFDDIPAQEVRAGDRLLLDDGTLAEVDDVAAGDFWVTTGSHGPAVVIGWQEVDGTACGALFRAADYEVHRVRGGAR